MDIKSENARCLAAAGAYASDGFAATVINGEINPFEEGDKFTMPKDLKGKVIALPSAAQLAQIKAHEADPTKPLPNVAQFVNVEVTSANGEKSVKRFYPSSLKKSAQIVDQAGESLHKTMRAEDAAEQAGVGPCSVVRNELTLDKAVDKLLGKTIVVEKLNIGRVRRSYVDRTNKETRETTFGVYKFAE